jgi:AcrR family transcriptional regulator
MVKTINKLSAHRKEDLLTAAADIFVEKGFHESKVSDIVASAGVAQGTFYLYFKNKNDIMMTLLNNCCDEIIQNTAQFCEIKKNFKNAEDLKVHNLEYLTNLLMMLESKHDAVKLILSSPVGEKPEITQILAKLKNSLIEMTKENLDEGIKAGYVRLLDSRIISEAIVGMIYSLAFERFVYKRNADIDIKKLAEEIINFEMHGITNE